MVRGNSAQDNKSEKESLPVSVVHPHPFHHKSYNSALDSLQSILLQHNAVILQGKEKTGKSTLINEVKGIYQKQGVEVISFTSAINTPRQLYSLLAEALHVPKLKKDLVAALQRSKATGKYCLVILDEAAVNSSAAASEALRKLCDPKSKTAGAIKVIVVSTDYLVIHTKSTYETDFHDWIKSIVPLNALKADELENLTRYLAGLKKCQAPQFEMGTDLELIEQSGGKIDSLISLINPLIDESVIRKSRFEPSEKNIHPLDSSRSKYYFLGAASVLVLIFGLLMRLIIVPSVETELKETKLPEDVAIFKSTTDDEIQGAGTHRINPPVLGKKKEKSNELTTEASKPAIIETKNSTSPSLAAPKEIPDEVHINTIPTMIDAWIKARKEQDMDKYLNFYGKPYSTTSTKGKALRNETTISFEQEKWLQLKREALDIETIERNQVKVEFWLNQISSKGAQSRIKKRLILISEASIWKINDETNLRLVKKT
ncbi:ATP-binding protein [Neptuniibacter sp.]|uniref:ATP-binding protein n=1 Tax=Neptuniibacter sp. TaxID=1962643 RepID=UPI003B5CA108